MMKMSIRNYTQIFLISGMLCGFIFSGCTTDDTAQTEQKVKSMKSVQFYVDQLQDKKFEWIGPTSNESLFLHFMRRVDWQ